jgi:hypothetical protein
VHESAARLGGHTPLVFRAGAALHPHAAVLPLPAHETTLSVVIGRTAWGGGGRDGLTVRPASVGWRADEEMYVAYAGAAGGALLLTRALPAPAADGEAASFGFWTFDPPLVRMACVWVGAYLASLEHDTAVRWNAALSLLAARQTASRPPAPVVGADTRRPPPPALGQDIRGRG